MVDARDFILERIEKRTGVDVPSPDPRIYVTTNELAKSVFTVIIFCPVNEAVCLEHDITRDFLTFFYDRLKQPGVTRLTGS